MITRTFAVVAALLVLAAVVAHELETRPERPRIVVDHSGTASRDVPTAAPLDAVDPERAMWALINDDRQDPANAPETKGQARQLEWDERLAAVARAHSADMLARNFFDHVNPDGVSPSQRVTAASIPWSSTAENIAIYGDVASAQAAFMNEPRFEHNHRANILATDFTHVGVGVVRGPDGRLWITQEFRQAP
jgi:uncharacterized protein YkwD